MNRVSFIPFFSNEADSENRRDVEFYSIAAAHSDIMLKDLAAFISRSNGKGVIFEIPDAVEAAGYSTATKARLDGRKLQCLGWKPKYTINRGIERTIYILRTGEQRRSHVSWRIVK